MHKSRFPVLGIFFIWLLYMIYFVFDIQLFSESEISRQQSRPQVSPNAWLYLPGSELILDTPTCRIPRTPIFPDFFKGKWKKDIIPECSYEQVVGKRNGNHFILYPSYQNQNCRAAEILRDPKSDNGFQFSNWTRVDIQLDLKDWEHFVVQCGLSLNFETNFKRTPESTKRKIEFWNELKSIEEKNSSEEDAMKPLLRTSVNVILLGIDTVSRSHAFRSLPKTIELFQQLGFHDFQGYHSVAPSTLTNFMAFLMGLVRTTVRDTCAPNWSSVFDSCPLIWQNYSASQYVTLFVEDGEQSFNWGGQSGYKERPTDFYAHHLFNAVEKMRVQSPRNNTSGRLNKWSHTYCHSNETSPQFVTRYTKEFVKKFQNVSFFSFTWYAYPFHEYPFSTQTLDDQLYDLYSFFASSPQILENTLLIFNSDHGDRDGFFLQEKIDGYIERGLPPLFIRIPEKLLDMYPEMRLNEVMAENTHELVSPFDLHHTLLHLLKLSTARLPLNLNLSHEFEPKLPGRQSLFTPVKGRNGTCEMLNLFVDSCVCNTVLESEVIDNPFYLNKVAKVLTAGLNALRKPQPYEKLCAKWNVKIQGIISNQVLRKTNTTSDILIRFGAEPVEAIFEAKVLVTHEKTAFDSVKLLGKMSRINKYGVQSACLPSLTDSDKEMKSFCYCNDKVKKSKYT